MKTSLAVLFAAIVIAGCGPAAPAVPPMGYLHISTPRQAFDTLKVARTELISPDVQLYKVEDGFRGTVKGQPIDMSVVGKGRIKGTRGGLPIDLHVHHEGEVIVVRGLFGGRLVQLRFSKLGIGNCAPHAAAQAGEDDGEGSRDPCNSSSAALIARMLEELGEETTMAFLATAYYR